MKTTLTSQNAHSVNDLYLRETAALLVTVAQYSVSLCRRVTLCNALDLEGEQVGPYKA